MRRAYLTALLACASGCSHIDFRWTKSSLTTQDLGAIKRLAVWAQADEAKARGLGATLSQMASEYAKLRRNYLVLSTHEQASGLKEVCQARVEGVLWLQALEAQTQGDHAELTLRAELWSCRGPQLVWSVQGHRTSPQADPNLRQLIDSYQASVGTTAATWAAPSFVLLQELLDKLPDPQLSDEDIEEKLELGWRSEDVPQLSHSL